MVESSEHKPIIGVQGLNQMNSLQELDKIRQRVKAEDAYKIKQYRNSAQVPHAIMDVDDMKKQQRVQYQLQLENQFNNQISKQFELQFQERLANNKDYKQEVVQAARDFKHSVIGHISAPTVNGIQPYSDEYIKRRL